MQVLVQRERSMLVHPPPPKEKKRKYPPGFWEVCSGVVLQLPLHCLEKGGLGQRPAKERTKGFLNHIGSNI